MSNGTGTKKQDRLSRSLKISGRIFLWLGFGVAATLLPFFLGIVYDSLSGYNVSGNAIEYIGDLLLIVIAISACVCSNSIASKACIKKYFFIFFSALCLAGGLAMYSFLYRKSTGIVSGITIIAWVLAAVILVNILIGIVIEVYNN